MIFEIKNGKCILQPKVKTNDLPDHARFSPSGVENWLQCPGYSFLESESTKEATKGTETHKKEEELLIKALSGFKEETTPYVSYIMSKLPYKGKIFIEEKFIKDETFFGTVDCVILNLDSKKPKLEIIDLKTGKYEVKPSYNLQLACYLDLFIFDYPLFMEPILFTIFQFDKATSWELNFKWYNLVVKDIETHIRRYRKYKKPEESFFKKGSYCGNCFKRNKCPVYSKSLSKDIKSFDISKSLSELPEKDFVELWKIGQDIKKHLKSIEKEIVKRDEKGEISLLEKKAIREVSIWRNKKEALEDKRFVESKLMSVSKAKELMSESERNKYISKRKDYSWILKR